MLLFAVLVTAQTVTPADIAVVVTRREGVSKVQSTEVASHCADVLRKGGLAVADKPVDGLSCGGKKSCLVALGRKSQHSVLVLLETATILDDGVLRAEAVSIEEDGKRLAVSEYEGSLATPALLTPTFTKLVAPLLKATQGKAAAAQAVPPPPDPVVAPQAQAKPPEPAAVTPPEPAPTPVSAPAAVTVTPPAATGPSGRTIAAVVLLAAGVAAGVGAGVAGGQALAENEKVSMLCPVRNQCVDPQMPTRVNPEATAAAERARSAQTAGIILAASGGALAVTGLVLLVTGTPPPAPEAPKVSVWAAPGAVSASLSLPW